MKLLTYSAADGTTCTGLLRGDGDVFDVTGLLASLPLDAGAARELASRGIEAAAGGLMRWLQAGAAARASFAQRLGNAELGQALPLASLALHAPVRRPGKIVGVGRNYADHAKETGVQPFEKPRIIFKMPSSIADPGATVGKRPNVAKMDFEGELAVVIGSFAREVAPQDALAHVAGYTLLNDLSAREFQFDITPPQTTFAKSMDGFCPLGPWLATADTIPDPQDLRLRTLVNDEVMQDATTQDMLFPVATLISYVSGYMTLEPGDVIATGTPAGIGAFRKPPVWLTPGDRIEVCIEGLGSLVTRIG